MTLDEMDQRAWTCGNRPHNRNDRVVVEEIWLAAVEICKRLDQLIKLQEGDKDGSTQGTQA